MNKVLENMPSEWLNLTTHRLDIYNEKLAKIEFLDQLETLYENNNTDKAAFQALPTAYDYIRLGHPLSCLLEWMIAKSNKLPAKNIISFSSRTMPILALLRKNLFESKNTQILYTEDLPASFDFDVLRAIYGYTFDLKKVNDEEAIPAFEGSTIYITSNAKFDQTTKSKKIDFHLNLNPNFGSIITVYGKENESYISEIQHVRRRESIAMTPANCLAVLQRILNDSKAPSLSLDLSDNRKLVIQEIQKITGANTKALLGSSGLSIQYAIMMGLIHNAFEKHPGKEIKFIVPPNCYGGTNDQARRVAACIPNVEVVDLPVDGDNDMVKSIDQILDQTAQKDAVPYIIAEIPTNPRVEVPDLVKLQEVLSAVRKTPQGDTAVDPVFILDQTFCPNVHFLGDGAILSTVRTISYVSGSKFPSGGLCTAGYCIANNITENLMAKVAMHLQLCDNGATNHQVEILAKQLPSMNQRINDAYDNTREFVNFIQETLPNAKINFVTEALAKEGFTPSVFSLDLPTKGDNEVEREAYKRALNYKLIDLMISEIPTESKFCVSYGQLSGCYWTIPATSTQGTTKEGDKDYIARVSLSPNMDLEKHKATFLKFVESM